LSESTFSTAYRPSEDLSCACVPGNSVNFRAAPDATVLTTAKRQMLIALVAAIIMANRDRPVLFSIVSSLSTRQPYIDPLVRQDVMMVAVPARPRIVDSACVISRPGYVVHDCDRTTVRVWLRVGICHPPHRLGRPFEAYRLCAVAYSVASRFLDLCCNKL